MITPQKWVRFNSWLKNVYKSQQLGYKITFFYDLIPRTVIIITVKMVGVTCPVVNANH